MSLVAKVPNLTQNVSATKAILPHLSPLGRRALDIRLGAVSFSG